MLYFVFLFIFCFLFFFFKQKTAYEMRISDWSSDVCSSDLIARMVVALHLEDGGKSFAVRPFADVDHAGILAGAADHPRRLGRELLQVDARTFIAAMLGPHDREDAEFDEIR